MLNEQQEKIAQEAVKWYRHSSEQTFNIAGYAGTGKTFTLNEILKRLHLSYNDILPMAYTGQAVCVMRTRGIFNACTCHSGLFTPVETMMMDEKGNIIKDPKFNVPIVTWEFIPKKLDKDKIKLIVIDEAWMVPKRFKKFIDDTEIKVIATGDPGQLPPIADDPGYLVEGNIHFLTELMRQSEASPIIYLANRAREGKPIESGLYGNDALVIFDDELDNEIISKSNIVLCGKNSTRENINNRVRHDILRFNTDYPHYGERVICRKNNWEEEVDGIPLVNGLTGSILIPPDIGTFDGETFTIDFQPDLLSHPFTKLKVNYRYLKSTHKEKDELKMNPFIMGERFDYAYGSTVHLAQGSEYYCGTYIEEYVRDNLQNALNYTAITRFKKKMVYVKTKPKFWGI